MVKSTSKLVSIEGNSLTLTNITWIVPDAFAGLFSLISEKHVKVTCFGTETYD